MKELIWNQTKIPKEQWRYGLRSSADTGCGWIATYNALRLLGYNTDIDTLIAAFERSLPLIHGNAGTTFWTPAVMFAKWGFPVKVELDAGKFDEIAKTGDVCILFYHWRKGWKMGAHFVALHKQGEDFVGYNTYSNSVGPDCYGNSLQAFLKRQKYFAPVLIAIKDKRTPKTTP